MVSWKVMSIQKNQSKADTFSGKDCWSLRWTKRTRCQDNTHISFFLFSLRLEITIVLFCQRFSLGTKSSIVRTKSHASHTCIKINYGKYILHAPEFVVVFPAWLFFFLLFRLQPLGTLRQMKEQLLKKLNNQWTLDIRDEENRSDYIESICKKGIPPNIELRSSTILVVEDAFLIFEDPPVVEVLWDPSCPCLFWDGGSGAGSCIADKTLPRRLCTE